MSVTVIVNGLVAVGTAGGTMACGGIQVGITVAVVLALECSPVTFSKVSSRYRHFRSITEHLQEDAEAAAKFYYRSCSVR